jgi:hypothetical protein
MEAHDVTCPPGNGDDARSARPRKTLRYLFVKTCVAVAAALAAAGAAASAPARAYAATPSHQCWGSNAGNWDRFHAAIPHSHCVRVYYDAVNVFPATWPRPSKGAWVMLSIRPNPQDLLSGKLDTELKTLIASAPAHSLLTIYHENAGANPLNYPPDVHNAANYVRMQRYMENLVHGTRVRFGVDIIAPFGSVLHWIYKADDWFGYDLYAFPRYLNPNGTINVTAVTTRMTNNLRTLQKFTGRRYPPVYLAETNARKDSQRKTWFSTIATWYATHDGHRTGWILTRWTAATGPHSGLSGPWPPSKVVVAQLRYLAWKFR